MIEFETATLAYAALSAWSTFAYAVVSLIVGVAQCVLIAWGIHAMRKASDQRDKALDAQMLALQEMIARTAPPRSAFGSRLRPTRRAASV